jgi:hypothetical protein
MAKNAREEIDIQGLEGGGLGRVFFPALHILSVQVWEGSAAGESPQRRASFTQRLQVGTLTQKMDLWAYLGGGGRCRTTTTTQPTMLLVLKIIPRCFNCIWKL